MNRPLYHYTKAIALNGILTDGFIATERKCGFTKIEKHTDFVWLTEKKNYPKTALPMIHNFPDTHLATHLSVKDVSVNYIRLAHFCGGLYRFAFSNNDPRLSKWWFSEERQQAIKNEKFRQMESVANKVGDEVRAFWFSKNDLSLSNFSLDEYTINGWQTILKDCSLDTLTQEQSDVVHKLKAHCRAIVLKFS